MVLVKDCSESESTSWQILANYHRISRLALSVLVCSVLQVTWPCFFLHARYVAIAHLPRKGCVVKGKELARSLLAGGRVNLGPRSQDKTAGGTARNEQTYLADDTVDGVRNLGEGFFETEELGGFVALVCLDRTRRMSD